MRTLLLIFSLAYTAIGQTTKCPAPYHVIGTGCYTYPDLRYSWTAASVFCQFSGGYLANIESEDEQIALREYIDANIPDGYEFVLLIGATEMISNGTWRWVPSGTTLVYNNWEIGRPSTSPVANCAMWTTYVNVWKDIDCCTNNGYRPLCEANPL